MTTIRANSRNHWNNRVLSFVGDKRYSGLRGRAVAEYLPRVLVVLCLVWAFLLGLAVAHVLNLINQVFSS